MKVLIIGAGTAGPALALALKRSGHHVEIFERAEPSFTTPMWEPGDLGGGFTVYPNFQRVLRRLGVLDDLIATSVPYDHADYLRLDGSTVVRIPLYNNKDDLKIFGTLRSAIAKAICSALNKEGVFVRGGKKLVSIDQPTDGSLGVRAFFEDGSSAEGDILVGADGVNSATRKLLFPEAQTVRSDYIGYVGVSEHSGEVIGKSSNGFTLLNDPVTGRSGWAGVMGPGRSMWSMFESRKGGEIAHDNWESVADLENKRVEMIKLAERWGAPTWFRAMIPKSVRIVPVSYSYLERLSTWHKHNCVLLGDAAHAILPFVGNGAAISMEDTDVLATLLAKLPDDPHRAFELFYKVQAERAYRVSQESIIIGKQMHAPSYFAAIVGVLIIKIITFITWLVGSNFTGTWIINYDSYQATVEVLDREGISI